MENFAAKTLLLMAILLPVVLFWLLRSRSRLNGLTAAAIAVATGWALNVVWAYVSQGSTTSDPSQVNGDTLSIACASAGRAPRSWCFSPGSSGASERGALHEP
jgi:hypothetical protein